MPVKPLEPFAPPAHLLEFHRIPNLANAWSDFLDQTIGAEIDLVENGLANGIPDSALGVGKSQFYNRLRKFQNRQPATLDIAWTGFPRTLTIRFQHDAVPLARFPLSEGLSVRPDFFTDKPGRPIPGLLHRRQDEYLEWRPEYDKENRLVRVTFTCESPEYWATFADGYPPPYYLPSDFTDFDRDPVDRDRRALFIETYRHLTGGPERPEELFFDRDIYLDSRLVFPKNSYNPWNRWNTLDGIVHLTHPSNTLDAEIRLAARATIKRVDSANRLVTDVTELVCRAGLGSVTRASDPTIAGKINELIRAGFSITLADPLGLYIDGLDTSGWTDSSNRPVGQEIFRAVRFDLTPGAQRILRAVCEVPPETGLTLADLKIKGEPIIFTGQIAECITMKLTGAAVFEAPVGVPANTFIHNCFHCKTDPDKMVVVGIEDQPGPGKDVELNATFPCEKGFVPTFPPEESDEKTEKKDKTESEDAPAEDEALLPEPPLKLEEIQGNILSGFQKDTQAFLFYQVTDIAAAREWLRALQDYISWESDVYPFNKKFRALRANEGKEPEIYATWLNIAFSYPGLQKFTPEAQAFRDPAFVRGLPDRSAGLGDPLQPDEEGHPTTWVFGGPEKIPDLILIAAADRKEDLATLLKEIRRRKQGAKLLYHDSGRAREDKTGREHFGFKDGISQPGIRGRINKGGDLFTPRRMPPGHPREKDFSRPGQPLVFPGQFVFGYPTQSDIADLPGPRAADGPEWMENGSFLVYRRLRQDVAAFRKEMAAAAARLSKEIQKNVTSDELAARLIGRLPNGTPLLRSATPPEPDMDGDAANNFDFVDNQFAVQDNFPPPQNDITGSLCPFAAHIRKVNPRDEATDIGGVGATLRRRILRRGLIFGKPVTSAKEVSDKEKAQERGLLFLSYQTSIVDQFEFLMSRWINQPLRPKSGGVDLLVGQNNRSGPRTATVTFDGVAADVQTTENFITPTGGGYFFAPSRWALRNVIIGAAPPPTP